MTLVKKHLRATYGLDSAGEKVINVGYPADLHDGVNVQYFIDENTVQEYDSTRGYKENFIIQYKEKLYKAVRDIQKPAGEFDLEQWNELRTDTQWKTFNAANTFRIEVLPGEQYLIDARYASREIVLPAEPQHGDSVWIKDEYNALSYNKIQVQTTKFSFSTGGSQFNPSVPGEMNMFVWNNIAKKWQVLRFFNNVNQQNIQSSITPSNGSAVQVGVGQVITVNSLEKNHEIKFPIFANDNEKITIIDEYQNLGQNPLKIHCFITDDQDPNIYKINGKSGFYLLDKPGTTTFVYKAQTKNWHPIFEVTKTWKKITQDYKTKAFEKLHLQPQSNITINLPDNAALGDEIIFANVYGYSHTVTIVPSTSTHKIVGDINQQYNRKYSQLTKGTPAETTSFVLPNNGQGTYVTLTYLEPNKWYVGNFSTRIEHVDENHRTRPGIAQLADQNEVNKNHEQNPRDDQIVTPKTLANKTSTETRRGIARIATLQEVNLPTNGNHLHDVIVTPRSLNNRQSTEEIRGVAEITTNTEVKDNSNDTHIITPKKLDHRRATETLSGVALLVNTSNPTAASSRASEGTGVYKNITNNIDIVTPKSLSQAQATENSKGVAWVSTQSEANEAKESAQDIVMITPKKLANRTALESRTGVARMVSRTANEHKQNITNQLHSEVFITPKALAEREATEELSGIAFIATQTETNAGVLDTKIITPLKFKTWLGYDHFISDTATGIEHQNNLWNKVSLTIRPATETQVGTLRTATQTEANVQGENSADNLYITPKKLDGRRATQTLHGIVKIANNSEVDAGTLNNETFISPAGLLRWTRTSQNAQFNETNRGVGRAANLTEAWVGTEFVGSSNQYQTYSDEYVITPRKLNYALNHYLPIKGKAYDSDKLDMLDSTQFLRSDVDTTNTANVTIKKKNTIGAIELIPIATSGTELNINSLRNKSGGLIYQNGNNFVFDNNLTQGQSFIFEVNGSQKAQLSNTGEFSSNIGTFDRTNITDLYVQNQMTYKSQSFDDYFVKSAGHIMTGNLEIKKSDGNSKLTLNGTAGNGDPELHLNNTNGNSQLVLANNGNLEIKKSNTNKVVIQNDQVQVTDRLFVKEQEVVDNNGKINYSLLKNVPDASIVQKGVVKTSEDLDENSSNLVPNMKVFHDLKLIVDQKADVVGSVYKNILIKDFLQIGNIRLVPDYENRQINFVWVDTNEEVQG